MSRARIRGLARLGAGRGECETGQSVREPPLLEATGPMGQGQDRSRRPRRAGPPGFVAHAPALHHARAAPSHASPQPLPWHREGCPLIPQIHAAHYRHQPPRRATGSRPSGVRTRNRVRDSRPSGPLGTPGGGGLGFHRYRGFKSAWILTGSESGRGWVIVWVKGHEAPNSEAANQAQPDYFIVMEMKLVSV